MKGLLSRKGRGRLSWTLGLLLGALAAARAQETTFSVCALNVDGLPSVINSDGPGEEGSEEVGRYLAAKGYDILALSEDFGYHALLVAPLEADYSMGTWRGGVDATALQPGHRADTDGLELLVRKPLSMGDESWTPWSVSHGFITDGADENITKGYRHYTVTLADGLPVDCYVLHMDAGGGDGDLAARASQLSQLCDSLKANHNGRPMIVMGDTNCRYTRDNLRGLLIDPLVATGRFMVGDAWVELCKGGAYPNVGDPWLSEIDLGYREGEVVDKVIYVNPVGGPALRPVTFDIDAAYQLGDHKPVAVTFEVENEATGVAHVAAKRQPAAVWSVNGVRRRQVCRGLNIVRAGDGTMRKVMRK